MSEWKSIESAPRDATEILLCDKKISYDDDGNEYVRFYKYTGFYDSERPERYFKTKWRCSEYDAFNIDPFCWMPLPEDPEFLLEEK